MTGGRSTSPATRPRDKGISINGLPVMLKQASYFDIDNLDVYYTDCVITGVGAFVIPIRERSQFVDATRTKLVREIAELRRPRRRSRRRRRPAAPRTSCLAGRAAMARPDGELSEGVLKAGLVWDRRWEQRHRYCDR